MLIKKVIESKPLQWRVAGVVRRRTLRRVPDTRCWLVGHHRSGGGGGAAAAVLAADAFTARWPTDLVVGRHDCRDFTNGWSATSLDGVDASRSLLKKKEKEKEKSHSVI